MTALSGDYKNYRPATMGQRIAFLRKQAGLTQAQLAEKMDLSAQAVSKWEGDLSCPDILMLPVLAKIFNVTTDELLGVVPLHLEEEIHSLLIAEENCNEDKSSCQETGTGNTAKRAKEEAIPEPSDIHSLSVDLGAAEVEIQENDHFSLTFIGFRQENCTSVVQDGVWKIKEEHFHWVTFGFRFHERKVIITIPRDFKFRFVSFKIGAGSLVGAGITAEGSHLDVGAGQITLQRFYSGPSTVECGMGEIQLEGALSGKCKIKCGMGNIQTVMAPPLTLGYEIDVGMGDVVIGEDHFGGMGGHYRVNTDAENFFDINCGMGAVKVLFQTDENKV